MEETEQYENQDVKMTQYTVSQHAAERFVERKYGYTNKTDKVKYANLRSTEIREFINKLCSYGDCIFEGKIREHNVAKIYKNKNWIIVVDPNRNNVITCYPLELGVGEEYDIGYVNRLSEKLKDLITVKDNIAQEINGFKENYSQLIQNNNQKINEYKAIINQLIEQNKGNQIILNNADADIQKAESDIYDLIDKMTGKKLG